MEAKKGYIISEILKEALKIVKKAFKVKQVVL